MIYQILRFPLVVLFFFFYRRIYFSGCPNIPKNAPTIIASNHSTAFMEQILVAGLQTRSVYFWAGGSVFENNPLLGPIFKQSHVIPVWRKQEGLKKMKQNKTTFENSKDIILDGKMLYIAPEGYSTSDKRLTEFKTGTARLALMAAAENNFEQDVFILPTGVNYTYPEQFRSETIISIGNPINVKKYKETYAENPILAAKQLTQELKEAISKEVILVDDEADDNLVEQSLILMRNEEQHHEDRMFSRQSYRLKLEQAVAHTCNKLPTLAKEKLKEKSTAYFNTLKAHQLEDRALAYKGVLRYDKLVKTCLLSPLAILGWIGGVIPLLSARFLLQRTIKNKQYTAPMTVVFNFITWTLYSLLIFIIGAFFLGWSILAIPLALILLQHTAFHNKEDWQELIDSHNYRVWKNKHAAAADMLENDRQHLVGHFKKKNSPICCRVMSQNTISLA